MGVRDELWGNGQVFTAKGERREAGEEEGDGMRRDVKRRGRDG